MKEQYLIVVQIQDIQFGQAFQAAHLTDSEKYMKYNLSQMHVNNQ